MGFLDLRVCGLFFRAHLSTKTSAWLSVSQTSIFLAVDIVRLCDSSTKKEQTEGQQLLHMSISQPQHMFFADFFCASFLLFLRVESNDN